MNKIYLFLIFLTISCSKSIDKPNLLFIIVDDLGWTDVSYNGSDYYETHNIDALSLNSMLFYNAYSASPVCSPTRASIMTGKHHARINITDWIPGLDPRNKPILGPLDRNELPLEELTIAEVLKKDGLLAFEHGNSQANEVRNIMINYGFKNIVLINDYQSQPRITLGKK